MKKALFLTVFTLLVMVNAFAHFQVIYTPDSVVEGSEVPFKIVFTHPFNAGHTMDIGKDANGEVKGFEEFNIIHKGKSLNAVSKLEQITFASLENSGVAYDFTLTKEDGFRGGGDWIIVAVPFPYYEGAEDIYIQQITKVMVNKADIATDWDARVAEGYPEIIPYVKPYAVWEGGMFRGKVVDCDGNPVPSAEIEVEFINYDVDMNANKFAGEPKIHKEGHGAAVILADLQGNFSFIPPKAGYWGFAALGAGGDAEYGGKELSLDAVLWIEAKSLGNEDAAPVVEKAPEKSETPAAAETAKSEGNPTALIIIIIAIVAIVVVALVVRKKKK